jgi:hypothetical protein
MQNFWTQLRNPKNYCSVLYVRVVQRILSRERITPSLSNTHTIHEMSNSVTDPPYFPLFYEETLSSRNGFLKLATEKRTSWWIHGFLYSAAYFWLFDSNFCDTLHHFQLSEEVRSVVSLFCAAIGSVWISFQAYARNSLFLLLSSC